MVLMKALCRKMKNEKIVYIYGEGQEGLNYILQISLAFCWDLVVQWIVGGAFGIKTLCLTPGGATF